MTILDSNVIDAAKVRTKYAEQFASEALARNTNAAVPPGIQYGFVLESNAGSVVRLSRHSTRNQSQAIVLDQAQEFSFIVTETDQPTFNLAAYAGTTVYLLLEIEYSSSGASTNANYHIVDAAELSSAVGLRSVVLGRVDVPAGGLISNENIIHGDVGISGLARDGIRRWESVFTNPDFALGFAGFQSRTDTGGQVTLGLNGDGDATALVLGSGSAPVADAESAIRFPIEGLKEADLIYIRSGITSQVALGASTGFFVRLIPVTDAGEQAPILDRTFYEGLDLSVAYQSFGLYLEAPAIGSDVNYVLVEVGESRGLTENGQIILDNLEAYVRSIDSSRGTSESWSAHRRVFVTGEPELAPVFDTGGGNPALRGVAYSIEGSDGYPRIASPIFSGFGFISGSNQPDGQIDLASSNYTASYRESVTRDAIRGSMAFEILKTTSPYQLVGGAVSNTATAVNLAEGSIRFVVENGGAPFAILDTYQLIDFPVQALDFTGRPSGEYYVSWSAQDAAFTIDTTSFISSIALREKVPLVYVNWDGSAFNEVFDIAYRGKNLLSKTRTITVGPRTLPVDGSARTFGDSSDFASLRQAAEFARAMFSRNVGASGVGDQHYCEIVLQEDFVLSEEGVDIPAGIAVRGASKNTRISTTGMATPGSKINFKGAFSLSDITFVPASDAESFTTMAVITIDQSSEGDSVIRNVTFEQPPSPTGAFFGLCIGAPDVQGALLIEHCVFNSIYPIEAITGSGRGNHIIRGCKFVVSPENNNANFMNMFLTDSTVIENCDFDNRLNLQTSTIGNRQSNGLVVDSGGNRFTIRDCRFFDMQLQVTCPDNLGLIENCHFLAGALSEVETFLRAQDFQGTIRDCSIRIVSATNKTYVGAQLVASTVSINDRDNIVISGVKIVATGDPLPAGSILCQVNGQGVKVSDCHFEMGSAADDANPLNEPRALFASQGRFQVQNCSFRCGSNEGQGVLTFSGADACQIIGNHFINFAPDRAVVLETDNNVVIGNIQEQSSSVSSGVTDNGTGNVLANNLAF